MNLRPSEQIAVYAEQPITYAQLLERAESFAQTLRHQSGLKRPLVLLKLSNSVNALVAYVACLQADLPVILLAEQQDSVQLEQQFQVNLKITSSAEQLNVECLSHSALPMADELSVLLTTSGSTGEAKLVMLSRANLASNAQAIREYLDIGPEERGLTSLPFNYSYGLSIVNSHLLAGASLVVSEPDILSKQLWQRAKQWQATSFAGVPFSYEMLCRMGLARALPSSISTLTQAGGRLNRSLAEQVAAFAKQQQKRFFIMYGQTEASARIAYLPAELASTKADSIGQAIPGGQLSLLDPSGQVIQQDEQIGELCYQGANVMLGYAQSLTDLAQPARPSRLLTGDLALRRNGLFYITGRLKRMIKLRSHRFNLDQLEQQLSDLLAVVDLACFGEDDSLQLASSQPISSDKLLAACQDLHISQSLVHVHHVASLPKQANGKTDYQALKGLSA